MSGDPVSVLVFLIAALLEPGRPGSQPREGETAAALEFLPERHVSGAPADDRQAGGTVPMPRLMNPSHASMSVHPRDERARALGLKPFGSGYRYTGLAGERFNAIVLRDGTVQFEMDPSIAIRIEGVCVVAICVPIRRKRGAKQRKARAGRVAMTAMALAAEAVGAAFAANSFSYGVPMAGTVASPGIRDPTPVAALAVQGRYGYLPEPTASMTAFMERTFDLRLEMAESAALENLESAHQRLPARLLLIWKGGGGSEARRAEILELWASIGDGVSSHRDDVLAVPLQSRVDARRQQLADEARRIIVDFVRLRAPEGSEDAFTVEEFEDFNLRPDVAVAFDPYGGTSAAKRRKARSPGARAAAERRRGDRDRPDHRDNR